MGLQRKASGDFGEMLFYFLPEILILFAIMSHIQKEIVVGLLYRKEESMETIKDAIVRYIEYSSTTNSDPVIAKPEITTEQQHNSTDLWKQIELQELCELNFDKEVRSFEKNFPERRYSIQYVDGVHEFEWIAETK